MTIFSFLGELSLKSWRKKTYKKEPIRDENNTHFLCKLSCLILTEHIGHI